MTKHRRAKSEPVTNRTAPAEWRWIFCRCPLHRNNRVPFEFLPKLPKNKRAANPVVGGYKVKL